MAQSAHHLLAREVPITSDSDSGAGTLRNALLTLQTGDILQFDPSLAKKTIVLESSLPPINTLCTMIGPSGGLITIDGQQQFSIFHLNGEVSIRGINLKDPDLLASGSALLVDLNARVELAEVELTLSGNENTVTYPILVRPTGYMSLADFDCCDVGENIAKHILLENDCALILQDKIIPKAFAEGSGNVYKSGTGIVALTTIDTSSATHDLPIVVEEGALVFTGKTNEPIVVLPGATLRGNHSSLYIANAGTVKPGQSIGIVLTQEYLQVAGATLQIEFTPLGAIDQIFASGDATIAGAIELLPERGAYYKGDALTFLTVGGVINGTFDSTPSSSPGLAYQIQYLPNAIQIAFLQNLVSYEGNQLSGNPAVVLQVLENLSIATGNDMRTVIAQLNALPDASSLYHAIDKLHPAPYADLGWAATTTLHQMGTALTRSHFPLCAIHCEAPHCCGKGSPHRLWFSGVGEWQHQNTLDRLLGFHANTGGILLGYDYAIKNEGTVGLTAGYTYTDLFWQRNGGKANIDSVYGATYSAFCITKLLVDAFCIASYNWNHVHRNIEFSGLHRKPKSSPHSVDVMGHLGFRLPYIVSPIANVEYTYFHRSQAREHRADSLNLRVASSSMQFVRAEVGALYQQRFCYNWGSLVPNVGLSYVYFTPTNNTHLTASFAGFDVPFTVSTTSQAINAIAPTASLGIVAGKNVSVAATYTGQFSTKWRDQTANITCTWQF